MPQILGVNGHPLSQVDYSPDVISFKKQAELIKKLGANWYRIDVPISGATDTLSIEDINRYKACFDVFKSEGINILPIIICSNILDHTSSTPDTPAVAYQKAYNATKAFVTVFDFEVFDLDNESNSPTLLQSGDFYTDPVTNLRVQYNFGPPDGQEMWHFEDTRFERKKMTIKGQIDAVMEFRPMQKTMVSGVWRGTGFYKRLIKDGVRPSIYAHHWYWDALNTQDSGRAWADMQTIAPELWITEYNKKHGNKTEVTPGNFIDGQIAQREYMLAANNLYRVTPFIRALFIYELLDQTVALGASNVSEASYGCFRKVNGEYRAYPFAHANGAF